MLSEEDVEKEYKTFVDENRAALNCDLCKHRNTTKITFVLQDIGKLAQEVNKDNANTFVSIDKLFPKASVVIPSEHGDLIIVDADLEENELSQ